MHLICGSIFSGLVAHDFNLNPVPDLAERWEVTPDGKTYTFHLAPSAVFHDGVPVTSADVKFTFEQLLMKYHSRSRTSVGDNLEHVSTPDAHTVGKLIAVVASDIAERLVARMRKNSYGSEARTIGMVKEQPAGIVVMQTGFGGTRIVDMLVGEQLPRIC